MSKKVQYFHDADNYSQDMSQPPDDIRNNYAGPQIISKWRHQVAARIDAGLSTWSQQNPTSAATKTLP